MGGGRRGSVFVRKGNPDNFIGRSHTKRRKTNRTRTEWLVRQRSLEQWHLCAVTFFNGFCVITNFLNGIHVKASILMLMLLVRYER